MFGLLLLLHGRELHADDADSVAMHTLPIFEARIESSDVSLGRPFELCLLGRHRRSTRVLWPESLELGDAFEQRARRVSSRSLGPAVVRSELCVEILVFDTATREIPALAIPYDLGTGQSLTRSSAALPLRVLSEVGADDASLRAPASPLPLMVRDWRRLGVVAGIAIVLGIVLGTWRWRRKRKAHRKVMDLLEPVAERSVHEEALARLAVLESSGALDSDELKPCYLEMSEILRSYLGKRFGFTALDLTTAEIRSRLVSVDGSEAWLESAMSWLSRCDLVKYAKTAADQDEAREALYAARRLIDSTRDVESGRRREVSRA